MKLILSTLLICFLLSTSLKAQNTNLKLEVNYPFSLGEFKNEYAGIVDLGVKYLFIEKGAVNLGISINGGLLKNSSESQFNSEFNYKVISFQPKIAAEFTSLKSLNLYPQLGLGYSFLLTVFEKDPENKNERGLNFNVGLIYELSQTLFIQIQYDYLNIKTVGLEFEGYDLNYKTSGGLLKLGIGINI